MLTLPAAAQTPNVVNGTPAENFVGESFCFDVPWTNTGNPGFGPYLRLVLPPDITVDSASFLGAGLTVTPLGTFPASPGNQLTDPLSNSSVTGPDGASLFLIVLPVGSVVTGGPDLVTQICGTISTMATVGTPLTVTVQPVYRFGDTATGTNGPIIGTAQDANVTPTLFRLTKSNDAPEGERTPGPDFPITYTLAVDVANGQTIQNLDLNDVLPANLQYTGGLSITGGTGCSADTEPSLVTPGGTLRVLCTSVTGTTGANELTVEYTAHVTDTLDETNCATANVTNNATLDAEDNLGTPLTQAAEQSMVTAKHLAIQKGASPGTAQPGDTITYTLNIQVSDFATASDLVVVDVMPDGLTFAAHTGMTVGGVPTAITPATLILGNDDTQITYDIHAVTGDLPAGTVVTVTYTATLNQFFVSPPDQILAADDLTNTVAMTYDLTAGAAACNDGSSATVSVAPIQISKSIVNPLAEYVPGDIVTFRLSMSVPSGDTDGIIFEDFLPLPVFDATSVSTTFGVDITHAPADTLGLTPTSITPIAGTNSVRVEWPEINSMTPQTLAIDLAVTVLDDPFADDLFLTNLFQATTVNTDLEQASDLTPVQLRVRAPSLVLTKGISASTNPTADATITPAPSSLPVDGDISASDAGDTLTYVITVENIGGAQAHEVTITDTVPAGLTSCAVTTVEDGLGTSLANSGDLFGAGLVLTNPLAANDDNPSGGGAPFNTDTALVTCTCEVDTTVNPRETITNTASVTWTSLSGAVAFEAVDDSASVTIADPSISKSVDGIAPGAAGGGNATSGDVVTYRLTVTLPEGTTNTLTLTDSLPAGFEFQSANVDTTGFGGTVDTSPTVNTSGTVDAGQTVTITFDSPAATTVTNDNNGANNSFSVTLGARVNGTSASNDGLPTVQAKSNGVSLTYTGFSGSAIQDSVSVDFAEPELAITKTMTPDTGLDAGDTVTITLFVENTGTAPAYDISVTDTLNDDGVLFDLTTIAEQTTPAGFSFGYANPTVTWTQTSGSLAAGANRTFTFTAAVSGSVISGSTFNNTAAVSGDSQDGVVTEERTSNDTGNDSAATATVTNTKSLVSGSETWTSDTVPIEYAVGEVLTFRVVFDIPEGVTQEDGTDALIVDTLPAGFSFLAGTATIRGVFDTSMTGSVFGAIGTVAGAIVPNVNGQDLEFDIGDLTNADDDAGTEQVIVEYDVLVRNTTDTNRTDSKTNSVDLNYLNRDGNPQSQNSTVTGNIAEPNLSVTKTALPASVVGGATVTFTVTITNTAGTNVTRAWEVTGVDVLPARFNSPSVTSATLSRGATDVTACANFTGNQLDFDMTCVVAGERYLAAGESITIVYTATVDPSIQFEESVTNTFDAAATSLPGGNGTGAATPGAPDSSTGERTGSGTNNELAQAVNDLAAMDSGTVTAAAPSLTKTGDATLRIGQTTNMTISVDVSPGTTDNFVVTDNLPTGLRYTGSAISITLPPSNFTNSNNPSTTPGAGTDPLVFDFGTITNSAAGAQSITIVYEVEVENVLGNQASSTLVNTATATYLNVSTPPSDTATITVAEANLEITKSITAGATGSDAGDTISYQVVVNNTNATATAFRVDLEDVLPADLLGANGGSSPFFTSIGITNPGNAVVLNGTATPLAVGDAAFATTTNTDDTLTWPLFELPPLTSLTITYDVVVIDTAAVGAMLTNDVTATYDSLQAGGGRDGSTANSDDDNDADLNNYNESDSATLTLDASLAIQKTLNAIHPNNDFTIGDLVEFDLRLDVLEGLTSNVTVTDVLPAGLDFITLVSIVASPNISFNGAGTAVEAPAGTITVDLGDVTNTADANNANDFLIVRLRAQVEDVVGNSAGTMLTNSTSATSDAGPAGPDTQVIDIVEPNLVLTKVPDDATPSLGDEVTFTVTVRHDTSTADAFEVVLTDVIPAGLTYVLGSTAGAAAVDETDPAAPEFDLGTITLAEVSKVFSFRARVDLDAVVGTEITNTITGVYSSQSGTPAVERNYNFNGSGGVTPSTPTFIDAVKTVAIAIDGGTAGVADPGDTLEYTITLTNEGTSADNVRFTDTVPDETTYVAASLTSSVGGGNDAGAPDLVVDVGTMANAAVVTITFRVTVDAGTPAGTVISNQGSVDSDQTVPEPTDVDGVDENGDQPTLITVGGPSGENNALEAQKVVDWFTDADVSGDITAGDRMRYSIVLTNVGDTDLTNVSLTDTIPTGLTYVAATAVISGVGNSVNVVGTALSASVPSLPVKSQVTVSFDVTIDGPLFDSDADPTREVFSNQGQVDSDQTDPFATDANGNPADGRQPTVFVAVDGVASAPAIDVEKRWALAVDFDGDGLVDPGDVLEYSLSLTNTGSGTAENVRLSDTIPVNTSIVVGSGFTSQGVVITEDPFLVNIGQVDPGGLVTLRFRVSIDGGTPDGTIIANQAVTTGDNFANENSDDNGDDSDGKNPTLTPVDTGGGSNAGSPTGLVKIVQSDSEAGSAAGQALIGEVLTFRVTIAVPAGLLEETTITDTLPTGLTYIAGTARLARAFDTGLTASENPGGVNGAATGTFVNLADGSDIDIAGQTLSLFLGDLINSDQDVDAETYTLEIQAVVANIAANQAGSLLTNSAGFSYFNGLGQIANLTPATTAVTVLEPSVAVTKSGSPAAMLVEGGDVTFTVTVTNPSGGNVATAYDLNLVDNLPGDWDSLVVDSITPSGGVSGVTDNSAATTVDIQVDQFPPDGQLIVVYTATAGGPLTPGPLSNTATATWTSLPGAQGTGSATPGDSGDADGERNGSGSGANDYSTNDSFDVTVGALNLTKSIIGPQSRYAVGDTLDYRVLIAVPDDLTFDDGVVTDVLPEGLAYVPGTLSQVPDPGLTTTNNPADFGVSADTPAAGQTTLTLNYGTFTNSDSAVRNLTLTYTVIVENLLAVQDNASLTNDVTLDLTNPAGGGAEQFSDDTSLTVGEPHLTLAKTITSGAAGLDAGDSVSFQIVVGNDGTTTAFEVVVADVLPTGLDNATNLVVSGTTGGAETPTFTNNGSDWTTSAFDVPVGGTVTITFDVTLTNGVIPGQTIQNEATATFTSRDGSDANERDGSDANSDQDNDADLDNYNESALSPTITVADPVQIDKAFHSDPTDTDYTIGETVGYRLTLSLIEGTKNDMVVTDTLPAGLRFLNAIVGVGNLGISHNYTDPPGQAGQVLTFDFGTVVNPGNGNTTDDFITVDITAVVEEVVGNVDGTVLGNHADVTFTGPSGSVTRDFDDDAGTAGIQPLDLTVVEPVLTLTKTASRATVPQGDVVTYTVLLDHTVASNADAFDLQVIDTLPAGLSYVTGSATIPVAVNGQMLTFDIAALTLVDDQTSFTYQVRVDNDQMLGTVLTNDADLTYTSRPGANADERSYTDGDDASITVATNTIIDAVKTVAIAIDGGTPGQLDPGDTLEYTVTLINSGAIATNTVFLDAIPENTTYVGGSLISSVGGGDDSGDPLRVAVGTMADTASVTITFRVTVDAGTPAGTVISNQGSVDSDQTVPEPTDVDGVDANGDQPTLITVSGPSGQTNALEAQKVVDWFDDADASGDITSGDRMRYTVILTNVGDADLTNVSLTDTIPTGLTYVAASAVISGVGNAVNVVGSALSATVPSLPVKNQVSVSFDVTIDGPLFDSDADHTREVFTNQGQVDSDQTEPFATDANGNPDDGRQPTVFVAVDGAAAAPALDLEKRWLLAVDFDGDGLVDPGDILEYSLSLINTGSGPATNAMLNDPIPANTSIVTGSGFTSQGLLVTEDPLQVNIGQVDPGGVVTLRFRVTVDGGTPDGTIIPNQATVSGDNFVDEPSDDNGDDGDGKNPTLTPVDTGGGSGAGTPSGLVKIVQADSEIGSGAGQVLIGEVLTYRITVSVPAGQLDEATLNDTLPTGLTYIAGTARLARAFDTGLTASEDPGGINGTASGVFVNLADGSDIAVAGQTLSLFLGDLINSDQDVDAETYTLEIQVVVANIAANQAGTLLTNSAGFSYFDGLGQATNLTPATHAVTVLEPNVVVAKSGDPAAMLVEGGDVTFTVTVTNPSGGNVATAYDLNLVDNLPGAWNSLVVDSVTPIGGVSGVTDNSSGTSVDIQVDVFPPAGQLVVVYTATANGPLTPGQLSNTAAATWTSLPGTRGTGSATPGDSGDADGERNGSGVGANDYRTDDTFDVTVGALNVTKSILNPQTRYAVGDVVNFQVVIAVPADLVFDDGVVTDVLDEGLAYVTGTLSAVPDAGLATSSTPADFSVTPDTPVAGQTSLGLNFGTFTNSDSAVRNLTLTYDVVVENILAIQDNATLTNSVTLDLTNPAGGGSEQFGDTTSLTVGEPNLTLAKTITSNTAGLDSGDSVSFQIVVGNTGTTTAFDVVVTDVLPTGLENATSLVVSGTTGGAETPTFVNNGGDWSSSAFDVPVGATVTITFDATLSNSVVPGQTIQNRADSTFTSRDGSDAGERDGSDPGSNQGDDSDLNNYNESDSAPTITVADPVQIDKAFYSDPTDSDYTIGETVGYRLTLSILEGTLNDLVVTDTLPDGLRFANASVGVGNMGISHNYGGAPGQVGQVLTFDFGDLINPANGSDADDFVTVDINAIVENVVANLDGTVLGNHASLTYTGPSGSVTRDFDADSGTPGIQPLDLTLVEPVVTIGKSASRTTVPQGDVVTFTVLLDHDVTSNTDAFDLQVIDTLPVGLTYVPGSATIPVAVNGQVLTFDIAALTLADDQTSFSYQVRVDNDQLSGTLLTNDADLTYTTQPGANADERSYSDGDDASVTVAADTVIDAVKTVAIAIDGGTPGQVDPGDTLAYTITATNTGATATNVVFLDPVPANTTYVGGSLNSSVGGEDDSSDPLRVDVGTMADGASVTIQFQVTVDAGTPPGTVISNQGTFDSDQTVAEPTDADGVDANGDQPTDIPVGGAADEALLYVQKLVGFTTDADLSGDITPGDTMTYTLLVQNLGATTLTNVTASDTIPTGLTYVAASAAIDGAGNTIDVVGDAVSLAIPSLDVGATVTATFAITIDGPPLFDSDATPTSETFVNQGTAQADQVGPVETDSNGDPGDGNQDTRFTAVDGIAGSPALDLEKRWALAVDIDGDGLVDPNDTLLYTLVLRNDGAATAENVMLLDPIPTHTTVVPGSAATSAGIVVTEDPLDVNLGDLAPGGFVTIEFQVTVDGGTPDGTVIANQATASGDNFPDEPSDDNGEDGDGKNPTLTPVDTGGGSAAGQPGPMSKAVFATSEAASTGTDVLVGEVVTFRVTVPVPAGTLRSATVVDTLPAGLTYLPGSVRLARNFGTGLTASLNPGGVNGAASGTFVALSDGAEVDIAGQILTIALGDLINSDNDLDEESYVVELQAVVANTGANQAGVDLTNSARLDYRNALNQDQSLTPASATVAIHEAAVAVDKSTSPAALLPSGGDMVFTVVVTNPAGVDGATAFDVRLTDALGPAFSALSVDSVVPSGVIGVTDNSAGTTLDITVDVFPADASLTVVYTATAPGPLAAATLSNTANVAWTSLPGAQGTGSSTPGGSGDADGERNGSGGVNDLTTADTAEVAIGSLNLVKTVEAPQGRYAIGDEVAYRIEVSLPGLVSVDDTGLVDVLAEGLSYRSGSLQIARDASVATTLDPADFIRTDDTPAAGQESLSLDLGTLSNSSDQSATLTLTYRAVVDNLLVNQENHSLINAVTLTFDDPGGGPVVELTDGTAITVGEPHLTLAKSVTSPVLNLEAGDQIDYEVVVGNDGTTTAFEVVLGDTLPAGLENLTALAVTAVTGGAETPVFLSDSLSWQTQPFDLPQGASVTITFTADLADSVIPGQQLQNRVDATFESRDDGTGRTGATPDSNQDDDSDLDNYNVSAPAAAVTVRDVIALDKVFHPDPTADRYTIGDEVGYRLTVSLIEGRTNDLLVIDRLPDGMRFLDAVIGSGHAGISFDPVVPNQVSDEWQFDFGDVLNPANGSMDDDFVTIDLRAVVENVAGNQADVALGNHASLSFSGPGGTEERFFDADTVTPGIQPLELTLVEPELTIAKATKNTVVSPGDELTFTITLDHSADSGADAFDIVVIDRLPAGLTYVPGSGVPEPGLDAGNLIWNVAVLSLAQDQTTFTYRARVAPDVVPGVLLENRVSAVFSGQAGDNDDERDGEGGIDDYVTNEAMVSLIPTVPVLVAEKIATLAVDADNNGFPGPGDTLTYTVAIRNDGNAVATSVVFTDTPDAHTALVTGSVQTTQGNVLGGNDGNPPVQVDLGSLAPSAVATVSFRVLIAPDLPAEVTQVVNQGIVSGDDIVDVPTDDPDEPGEDDPTITPVVVMPAVDAEKTVVLQVDGDNDGAVSPGDVLRYQVDLRNTGNGPATQLVFLDTPDTATQLVPGSVSTTLGSVVAGNDGNPPIRVEIDTLPALTGQAVIVFDVQVVDPLPAGVTHIANQGTVDFDEEPDPVLTDDPDTEEPDDPTVVPVASGPALQVTKDDELFDDADTSGNVSAGDLLRYTLEIANVGNATATDVVLNDDLEPNLELVVGTVTTSVGSVTIGNGPGDTAIQVDLGDLAQGATVTVTYQARIVDPLPAGVVQVVNQAVVTSPDVPDTPSDDPDQPGDDDPTVTPVGDVALLNATKTDTLLVDANGDGVVSPADVVRYRVRVVNNGNIEATGVIFTDTPDALTAIVPDSVTTSQGVVLTGRDGLEPLFVSLGSLAPNGGFATITFDVRIALPFPVNLAQVGNQGVFVSNETDPVSTDDPETAADDDITLTPVFQADLAVLKTGPGVPVVAGTQFDYGIEVSNLGPNDATQVVMTDALPAALEFVTASTDRGDFTFEPGTNTVTWQVGSLAVGESVTMTLTVGLLSQGEVVNQARVDAVQIDPNEANNVEPETVDGLPGIDLSLTKTVDPADVDFGDEVTYTLVVANAGPDDATGVVVQDLLPDGLTFVSSSTGAGSYDAGTGLWNLGSLAVGAQATLTIVAEVTGLGSLTNMAQVVAADQDDVDSTPDNGDADEDDQDSVTLVVDTLVDLVLSKEVVDHIVSPGDELVYLLTLSNLGPSDATGVVVTDILPEGVVFQGATVDQGSFEPDTGEWLVGDLPVDQTVSLTLVTRIDGNHLGGELVNFAVASANEPEDTPEDNEDAVSVRVTAPVPTLGPGGLAAMILGLMLAVLYLRRRREMT
ncbi:isopeptide-forming domain-containing fimbrial protein [Sulfidibacter corallicola]|uniref:DUF11 domain-containing protein n=1 Tax=Sulfidibacter corallicola TaxID=2818388 RepID=A0A8A4TPL5_SULCO|nr:isopeptide-forming domain-containing fimbrial protein [Sulfidibacter corallicola]QTD48525.1 DUF11 domain-containing protein [Sulfidibacter corallicola]